MIAPSLDVLVERLAWTLIHFLWQGGLIALVLASVLALTRERAAAERYLIRCAALMLMSLAPVITFLFMSGGAATSPLGPTEAAPEGVLTWIVLMWVCGAAICSLRMAGGCLQVLRLRRRLAGVDLTSPWQERFDRLARDFGVRARARVVDCATIIVPTVIGWFRPIVLLPARLFTGLSEAQIEALLAHELAHVARHDYLVNLLQTLLEALLFYHPAVWWVSHGIRVEREYCCDDRAVAAAEGELPYARALTALESWRRAELRLGVSASGGSLARRVLRLVGGTPASRRRPARGSYAVAALIVIGSMGASAIGLAGLHDSARAEDSRVNPSRLVAEEPSQCRSGGVEESVCTGQDTEELRQTIDELLDRIDGLETQLREYAGDREAETRTYPKLPSFYEPKSRYLYLSPEVNGVLADTSELAEIMAGLFPPQ